jgi:GNAT superfamily N-acetyltransferase
MQHVREISYNTVKPLASKALKDKVCLKDTATTKWFAAYDNDVLLGVAGSILKNGNGRIRGVYVLPEYRKLGAGRMMMDHIMYYFSDNGACYVDQLSSHYDWWVKQGWKIKSIVPNGAWIYKTI